jgi:hypothetical protein
LQCPQTDRNGTKLKDEQKPEKPHIFRGVRGSLMLTFFFIESKTWPCYNA